MSAFPSLPLFTDAWVADTKHLSRLERGTYHDLIVLMWRSPECRVPNDDEWLSRRMGMTLDEVKNELRPIIAEFMQTDGNWLFQKRLRKEFDWCKKNSRQRSDAAKSRWSKEKTPSKRNANTDTPRNAPILSYPTNKMPPAAAPSPEVELFRRGKDVLGRESGGLIKNLVKAKAGDIALARAAIETASTKANPREYVGGVIRGGAQQQDSFLDPQAGIL